MYNSKREIMTTVDNIFVTSIEKIFCQFCWGYYFFFYVSSNFFNNFFFNKNLF